MRTQSSAWRGIPRSDASLGDGPIPDDHCRPSFVLFVDGETTIPLEDQDGTLCFPFATIQQALDFIGAPANAAAQADVWLILCAPGDYDEDLTVPARRRILVEPWGYRSGLSYGIGGGFETPLLRLGTPTSSRSITWTSPSGVGTEVPFFGFVGSVTGDIAAEDGGDAAAVNELLVYERVGGAVLGTAHAAGSLTLDFDDAVIAGEVTLASASSSIRIARETLFAGPVECRAGIGEALTCVFEDGISSANPGGGFATLINCRVTGDVEDITQLAVDGVSEFSIELTGAFVGTTTYDRIDDPIERSVLVDSDQTMDAPTRVYFVEDTLPPVVPGPPRTLELPAAPKADDEFMVFDTTGTASVATPIRVDGNGNTINGLATVDITSRYGGIRVKFKAAGITPAEWIVIMSTGCCGFEIARTENLASAALPAASAFTAQAFSAVPPGTSKITYWLVYTRSAGTRGRPMVRHEETNGTESTTVSLLNAASLITPSTSLGTPYGDVGLSKELLKLDAPSSDATEVYQIPVEIGDTVTGVRLLVAEFGAPATPGTAAVFFTGRGTVPS